MAIPPSEGEDFAITLGGDLIGKAGFRRFPEIGFLLARSQWGNGYAREAVEAVINRAFGQSGLDAITAEVDPRNINSLLLLDRMGFVEVERIVADQFIGGQWCDTVRLVLRKA